MTSAHPQFEVVITEVLNRYSHQTENLKGLRNYPLASEIHGCKSAGSLLKLLQNKAEEFDGFSNGGPKLLKYLEPVVESLASLFTSPAVRTAASHVSPSESPSFRWTVFNVIVV
jgi:hypothetical protein